MKKEYIAAIVVMMMCCSSSSMASMMMGGGEDMKPLSLQEPELEPSPLQLLMNVSACEVLPEPTDAPMLIQVLLEHAVKNGNHQINHMTCRTRSVCQEAVDKRTRLGSGVFNCRISWWYSNTDLPR
jgi:hypothetical protein